MAKGMEMLVGTVIKSLGLEPDLLIAQATEFVGFVTGKVKEFDVRLYDLENQNAQLLAQNAQFLELLNRAYPLAVAAPEQTTEESE